MKRKGKRVVLTGLLAAVLGGLALFGAVQASALTTEKLANMDEASHTERLETLDKGELIALLNGDKSVRANDLSYANDGLYAVAAQLAAIQDSFSNEELIAEVCDNGNQVQTRCILMDLYSMKNEAGQRAQLKEMLVTQGDTLPQEIKLKAIVDVTFERQDIPLLKSYVAGEDELVAFHGLKQLAKVDMTQALAVSDDILDTYSAQPSQKVSAAQAAKSKYYRLNPDAAGKAEFIALCEQIAAESSQDEVLRDSSTFALSALRDYDSVQAVVNHGTLDRISKVAAINENFMTLWDVLKNNPTQEDVAFIVTCMELHPVKDLADDLEQALAGVSDSVLKTRGEAAVERMRGPEGIEANYKWVS